MRPQIPTALLALALTASAARAQIVRGVVAEEGSNTLVEGAMVIFQELDGTVVHRVLTDAAGAFIARLDHPGVYQIRVDRIGYASLTTERFDVPVDGTFQRVSVPIRPVELMGIDVAGSRRCQLRADQGPATARVWEEARKALEAAAWTLSSGAYRYTLLHFERTLEPDRRTVLDERRRFIRSTGQAPYVSLPVEDLVAGGFIRENPNRTVSYFAPDAEAFLADAFLDTHCMRLQEVKDGRVGLAFEPVGGRRMPDIRGTLWIDAATATLELLDFTYVNLPPDHNIGVPGGQVVFGRLPNGTWIVRDWSIHMPILQTNPQRTNTVVRGYRMEGGTVWRVIDRSGAYLLEATTASVSGTVMDSTEARPLEGALVRAEDGGEPSTTLGTGTFLLSGLAEGLQRIVVNHPSLDTLGLGPVSAEVEARAGEITPVRIRVPGVGEVVTGACAAGPIADRETAVLLGRVRRGGAPAGGAVVRLRWLGGGRGGFEVEARAAPHGGDMPPVLWANDPLDDEWLFTTLDARGIFILCGIPTGSQVRVEVTLGDEKPSVHTATLPRGTPLVTLPINLREISLP
jgi:hypothetical protein